MNYWRGTMRMTGTATTYAGAMRLASRNQNAYAPTFFHGTRKLADDGNGLAYEDELERGNVVYAV